MRARALLLSPASLCQTFVPRNYKDHLRAELTRCIPRAFETTRFRRFHTRRILQNINKILMERFAVRIYRLRDSRYLQLVTKRKREYIPTEIRVSYSWSVYRFDKLQQEQHPRVSCRRLIISNVAGTLYRLPYSLRLIALS